MSVDTLVVIAASSATQRLMSARREVWKTVMAPVTPPTAVDKTFRYSSDVSSYERRRRRIAAAVRAKCSDTERVFASKSVSVSSIVNDVSGAQLKTDAHNVGGADCGRGDNTALISLHR